MTEVAIVANFNEGPVGAEIAPDSQGNYYRLLQPSDIETYGAPFCPYGEVYISGRAEDVLFASPGRGGLGARYLATHTGLIGTGASTRYSGTSGWVGFFRNQPGSSAPPGSVTPPRLSGVGGFFRREQNRAGGFLFFSRSDSSAAGWDCTIEFLIDDPRYGRGINLYINWQEHSAPYGSLIQSLDGDEFHDWDLDTWYEIRLTSTEWFLRSVDGRFSTGGPHPGAAPDDAEWNIEVGAYVGIYAKYIFPSSTPAEIYEQGPGSVVADDLYVLPNVASGEPDSVRRSFARVRR